MMEVAGSTIGAAESPTLGSASSIGVPAALGCG
eukprot:CAMPEP_0170267654 /NCGR_PEP_ID=MMETSP0116_2-20130129/33754_1 /TAXON_ID=400756 /ORGANISM="Durinskia baltica, Strain CSIRO CS-38" /LENGTH=32 /DNA_ID= /DNA_START= /DNA_END= /DNA_ORIENTATION=